MSRREAQVFFQQLKSNVTVLMAESMKYEHTNTSILPQSVSFSILV